MNAKFAFSFIVFAYFCIFILQAKTLDPYKVLGVEKNASQREIQKAFHKLSLQYHPDKNKNKGAQEKFAEINNAYDLLSDEEKRKNYDLYGDEKGNPGFGAGHPQDGSGYTHFTSGGPGHSGFNFRPDEWQNTGGQGNSKSFSFSFGNSGGGQNSFGFGLDDIFSNFFGGGGMKGGESFGNFGSSKKSQPGFRSSRRGIPSVNSQVYGKEISDKGITWLLLSYSPIVKEADHYESIVEEAASSLEGGLKVGKINCENEMNFCKDHGIYPRRAPRVFVYSYTTRERGSLVEYTGDLSAKSLTTFCKDHLPAFSKRVDLGNWELSSEAGETVVPKVMLLSTKKNTPIIWRVLSGLYHKRFVFYDAEVHDISDPDVRRLGVDALPAIVGWLSNGQKRVLKTGISVKNLRSAVDDLSGLLNGFEKENKKASSNQAKAPKDENWDNIPLLTGSNLDALCGEKTPVCIIGAFRSPKAKDKLQTLLLSILQNSMLRRRGAAASTRDSISYALLDATQQQSFLNAFQKSGFKSSDKFLLAYKPRKGKFAAYEGDITKEEVEKFISSVLNGDVNFTKTRQKPAVK